MTKPAGGDGAASAKLRADKPYFSWDGFRSGVASMLPLTPSQIAFGGVFGMLAAQKGLSALQAVAMSGWMFAGLAQIAVLQVWPDRFTLATMIALMIVALTINLRFFLMSVTFRPWFGALPAWQSYAMLLFTTDPGWLKSMRYHSEGGRDVGYFFGGGIFLFVTWCLATGLGHLFSGWLTDTRRFGIDLVVPAFFAALLVPIWKGPRRALPWAVGGLVATVMFQSGLSNWSIAGGAVAGALAAGAMRD
jgi:predicted branched-subunit amino acid permease